MKAWEQGLTQETIAHHLIIAQSSVSRILKRNRKGQLRAGKPPGRPRRFSQEDDQFIAKKVKEKPDITIKELIDAIKEEFKKTVSSQTINCSLKCLNFTRKKTYYDPEKDSASTQEKRKEFKQRICEIMTDRLVFIDETGTHLAMARDYGRAMKGKRLYEAKRQRPKTSEKYTWISAFCKDGLFAHLELICYQN